MQRVSRERDATNRTAIIDESLAAGRRSLLTPKKEGKSRRRSRGPGG